MGLWLNLGFVLFIILAVLSGNVRADERPLLTPFTVCPLDEYRMTQSEYEFVQTKDTFFVPYFFQIQVFQHPQAVKQASDFVIALTESKREILRNNQRQIQTLISCMSANSPGCEDPKMKSMVQRYMGNDLKKALGLFRVFESLAFRPGYEDLYVIPAFWSLETQINYKLENYPGLGLIKAKQAPLTAEERTMAENLYLEWWESFSVEVEKYWLSEMKSDRASEFQIWQYNQALGKIREARLQTDRTKLVSALMFADVPGWKETVRYRQQEFRDQMFKSWFDTFNAFRVFSYVPQANPSLPELQSALLDLFHQNESLYSELGAKIESVRKASWTWGSDFSLADEPKSLLEYTLATHESQCRIASNLYMLSVRGDTQGKVVAGALFVASFWLPTQVVVPLFIGVAGYSAYQSEKQFDSERAMFLSFMSEQDTFTPGNRVLFALSEKVFNELLVPLSIMGMPKAVRGIGVWLGM